MNILGANSNGFDWGGRGPSNAIAFPNLYQVFGSQGTTIASRIRSNLAAYAQSQAGSGLSATALQEIFRIQSNLIIDNNGEHHVKTWRSSSSHYFI